MPRHASGLSEWRFSDQTSSQNRAIYIRIEAVWVVFAGSIIKILDIRCTVQGRQFITCKFAFLRSEKSRNEGEEVGDNLDPCKPSFIWVRRQAQCAQFGRN